MKLHYLQHVNYEEPGCITDWASNRKFKISSTHLYNGDELPESNEFDWLIVMGGPMGIYDDDKFPWLKSEKVFIKKTLDEDKTVIGICLGSQLIADALGAKVYKNRHKEIGWMPVTKCVASAAGGISNLFPEEQTVFHWHGDTFDLPNGAVKFAESEATRNQAFVYRNNVLALQFHLEVTEPLLNAMIENGGTELIKNSFVQTCEELKQGKIYIKQSNKLMFELLDKMRE
jgi:GMP synthase (glutamine-hydrolysing)